MSLCFGCFEESGQSICPLCGYDNKTVRSPLLLAQGTILRQQYIIGRVLGKSGGFGTTYLGYNQTLQLKVAIKEYLPCELVSRGIDALTVQLNNPQDEGDFKNGIDQFLEEARLLVKFNHPNIVRVIDFFEENQTAYLVMDYYQGVNIAEYLEQQGKSLTEQAVLTIMLPILEGLKELHNRGILHRDIKPQNIYLTTDGRPLLLDFGAAKQMLGEQSRSLALLATSGFSPYEQYHIQGKQGPWTDIYGCAATMYYMLSGMIPVDAIGRMAQDTFSFSLDLENKVSPEMRQALLKAMALLPENRVQNLQEFQNLLLNKTVKLQKGLENTQIIAPNASTLLLANDASQVESNKEVSKTIQVNSFLKSTTSMIALLLIIIAIAAGGGYWYYQQVSSPVNQLSQKGIPFTEDAFFNAVKTNDIETVKMFLAGGMSANTINKETRETPLIVAIEAGQLQMVNFLIANGVDLTLKNQPGGLSSLDFALKQGNVQILKILMDQLKITPDTKDEKDKTLLEKAIDSRNMNTVKFLIEQGAAINAQNEQGQTLLDQLLESENKQMADLLKTAGAKRNINIKFKHNQLNKIELSYANQISFEVDLLGDGIGQKVTINKSGFGLTDVTISEEGKALLSFKIYGTNRDWYVAYLRDDHVPDLVYFYTDGSGNYINDFKIIGKTAKDTLGLLFNDYRLALGRDIGGGARLSIDGTQLLVQTNRYKTSIEWNGSLFKTIRGSKS